MSVGYRAVGWNPSKRRYDLVLAAGVALYLALFALVSLTRHPDVTLETVLIRAFGSGALLLLHVILSIGPLCRLSPRWLPLLYNRRHLGVTMFLLALLHGGFALVQFHALGDTNPFVSVLTAETSWGRLARLPFQPLGAAALLILFLLAATSHDFWLANLTAPVWKSLHMLVYVAWVLVLLHVAFGALQDQIEGPLPVVLLAGLLWVGCLHLVAAQAEAGHDRERPAAAGEGWVDVCAVDSILEGRARTVVVSGERIAVFRWDGRVAALSNVCQHQNGPLGEGRIVDGCVTCPWHGYQYRPEDGRSPPPFTEAVPTFAVRVERGRVLVATTPCAPGTVQTPATVPEGGA
ncbi:MAG TPA: Rieske 2Fe-2S domain-containing protein [Planctomycetota bacterium]|nr:Rieske 2Fe-2S domain-containing protein [Planctomycetota bacterium]